MNHTALGMTSTRMQGLQTIRFEKVELEAGGRLYGVNVAYETYGELNREGTNAILVCHALTGDSHAYGWEEQPGWWQGLIGPGRALDTNRYYIICSNVLGGCSGTTGPQSVDPETGRPYGSRFPLVTTRDMVRVQHGLVCQLGITQLQAVIGGSMGGLQAIEWAVSYPQFVRACIPMACSPQLSALAIGYNDAMRMAILNDPDWRGGDYYGTSGPVRGFALARKIGMITYRSFELFEQRFGRETTDVANSLTDTRFQIESYLDYMGGKILNRFDAGSYLSLIKAMDLHDVGRGRGGAQQALARIEGEVLWVGIDSDRLFPAVEQREWAHTLQKLGKNVTYKEIVSEYGHDAFLIEYVQLGEFVRDFLQRMGA